MSIKRREVLGFQGFPVGEGGFQVASPWCERSIAACYVFDCHLVGCDQPARGARLDRHVADCHSPFHGQCRDRRAVVLDDVPHAPACADGSDHGQDDVLRFKPGRKPARDLDSQRQRAAPLATRSASPARAQPRSCQSRKPGRRMPRGYWCGCRRKRWSFREA